MSFLQYIKWLFVNAITRHKTCGTCTGSDGHCYLCDELKAGGWNE